jgi:hypothetical protein
MLDARLSMLDPPIHPILDAGSWMLDPPTRPNLPADDADNADS